MDINPIALENLPLVDAARRIQDANYTYRIAIADGVELKYEPPRGVIGFYALELTAGIVSRAIWCGGLYRPI